MIPTPNSDKSLANTVVERPSSHLRPRTAMVCEDSVLVLLLYVLCGVDLKEVLCTQMWAK